MLARLDISWLAMALATAMVAAVLALAPGDAAAGGVPQPEPARGKGEACVAETDFMRRNHPSLLEHQRDDTLRQGIRGDKFSLKECVACHAVPGADAKPITVQNPKHFCRECHEYAAVQIDCVDCHNSVPDDKRRAAIDFTYPVDRKDHRTALDIKQCRVEGPG